MKKREIRPALDALKTIKMPLIEDKELRNLIIRDHFQLLGEQKRYSSDFEDARTATLSGYEKDQEEVVKLDAQLRGETDAEKQKAIIAEIEKHKGYLDAVKMFNETAAKMGEEEVEIEHIDADKFIAEYQKQDYDMGVVEALYPLFKV